MIVCLSFCLSVLCPLAYLDNHIAEIHQILFACSLAVDRCDMLCTSGFADDVMFSHDGPCSALCIFLSGESITADTTASILIKFCLTMMISKNGNRTKGPLDKVIGQKGHGTEGPPDIKTSVARRKVHPRDQYALAEIVLM